MKILLLEPFCAGSHQQWAEALQERSRHQIELLSLSGHHWKWRMHGAAITLAERYLQSSFDAELILATDMLDLATFLALARHKIGRTKVALYFHENQLTYPWSPNDADVSLQRDQHYAFINYSSALAADCCLFNSQYHLQSFTQALPGFLRQYPSPNNAYTAALIQQKSRVLHLGMNLSAFEPYQAQKKEGPAVLLWNHRWEYDKNPEGFFQALFALQAQKIDFRLIVLGEKGNKSPAIFEEAKARLSPQIIHWGYAADFSTYARLLWQSDILPVSSYQDFFGMSIIEAVYCGATPLLPRRLAYPEHFSAPHLFYESPADFEQKLKLMIEQAASLRLQSLQATVLRYDWTACIDHYDQQLEGLL